MLFRLVQYLYLPHLLVVVTSSMDLMSLSEHGALGGLERRHVERGRGHRAGQRRAEPTVEPTEAVPPKDGGGRCHGAAVPPTGASSPPWSGTAPRTRPRRARRSRRRTTTCRASPSSPRPADAGSPPPLWPPPPPRRSPPCP